MVSAIPSLRPGKLRLNDETIESTRPGTASARLHCPMQGPQALASTVAPIWRKVSSMPSRSTVS